jgi:hypothetical protein
MSRLPASVAPRWRAKSHQAAGRKGRMRVTTLIPQFPGRPKSSLRRPVRASVGRGGAGRSGAGLRSSGCHLGAGCGGDQCPRSTWKSQRSRLMPATCRPRELIGVRSTKVIGRSAAAGVSACCTLMRAGGMAPRSPSSAARRKSARFRAARDEKNKESPLKLLTQITVPPISPGSVSGGSPTRCGRAKSEARYHVLSVRLVAINNTLFASPSGH